MSPATPGDGAGLTRSEIENWDTSYLDAAATAWRLAATRSEDAFDQHRQNIASPGGTTWEGNAKDAALDRVTADVAVVGRHGAVLREAGDLAENGAHDINAAQGKVVEAITTAEDDGFHVAENLKVTDARKYDIATIVERNRALAEHAEDIRWTAEQLVAADKLVGTRLQSIAAELDGIRFDGEGDGSASRISFVSNEFKLHPQQGDDTDKKKPEIPAQTPGQIGPFAVPKSVEDEAKKNGLKPGEKPPATTGDVGGDLGDLLGANDPATAGAEPKPTAALQISPQQVQQFKDQARNLLRQQGVPPDQIESRVNAMVADAQRMNAALADSAARTPPKPDISPGPAPDTRGFGEKLGDKFNNFVNEAHDQFYNRLDSTVDTLQNLTGTGGAGHPGVLESWQQLYEEAVAHHMEDPLHLRDPLGPLGPWGAVNGVVHDIPEMIDNPGKYAGDKMFEGAAAAVTAPLGGEALLGRSVLSELGALERGVLPGAGHTLEHGTAPVMPHTPAPPVVPHTAEPPVVPHTAEAPPGPHTVAHAPPHVDAPSPHVDHPTSEGGHHSIDPGGHGAPGGHPLPFDIDNPIPSARPEFNIVNPLEHMSPELRVLSEQHLTGSGETVLGPYRNPIPGGPSYIELAQQYGASYFDIGDAWNVSTPTQQLAANQHVLDMAIANRDTIRLSVSVDMIKQDTFTGAELRYLQAHGYEIASDGRSLKPPKAGG